MVGQIFLAIAILILGLNIGYMLKSIARDIAAGQRWTASLGIVCLVGVNLIIGWLLYAGLSTISDS